MSIQAVLLPLFVEVIVTFVLLYWMAHLRTSAFRKGNINAQDVALREPNWPPHIAQVGNAYHNQLELPVLFYVLTILAWITRQADLIFVVLAWLFTATSVQLPSLADMNAGASVQTQPMTPRPTPTTKPAPTP